MRRALTADDMTFIGIRGTVVALERATGAEIWRTPLKGSCFTNLVREGDYLLAAARGELFCLDPFSGRVLWNNPLRGLGYGIVTFASADNAPAAMQQMADEESANASTTVATTAAVT